jgi:hypothetical protein
LINSGTDEIYGTSLSTQQVTDGSSSGIGGSIKQQSSKLKDGTFMLNRPADAKPAYDGGATRALRNRESGTHGMSNQGWTDEDSQQPVNFTRDIEDEAVPVTLNKDAIVGEDGFPVAVPVEGSKRP